MFFKLKIVRISYLEEINEHLHLSPYLLNSIDFFMSIPFRSASWRISLEGIILEQIKVFSAYLIINNLNNYYALFLEKIIENMFAQFDILVL